MVYNINNENKYKEIYELYINGELKGYFDSYREIDSYLKYNEIDEKENIIEISIMKNKILDNSYNKMNEDFFDMFTGYKIETEKELFGMVFKDFIKELSECDLSKNTLNKLYQIFVADMKLFFKKLDKFKGDDEK